MNIKKAGVIIYGTALAAFTGYVMLDTFTLPTVISTDGTQIDTSIFDDIEKKPLDTDDDNDSDDSTDDSGNEKKDFPSFLKSSSGSDNGEDTTKPDNQTRPGSSKSTDRTETSAADSEKLTGASSPEPSAQAPSDTSSEKTGEETGSSDTEETQEDHKRPDFEGFDGSGDFYGSFGSDMPSTPSDPEPSGDKPDHSFKPDSDDNSESDEKKHHRPSGENGDHKRPSGSSSHSRKKKSAGQAEQKALSETLTATGEIGSYTDENYTISIKSYRECDTTIYVADVKVTSAQYLKTALAGGSYGKNVSAPTSQTAKENNAVFAVNGDFYGARESGYVIRNGILYRDTASDSQILTIYADGSFGISSQDVSAQSLLNSKAWQVFAFGPALVENGEISSDAASQGGKIASSNPRTAIGMIEPLHYIFAVTDGRTSESEGLTLDQLAQFMQKLGAQCAYNLDGGGSSTMYFNCELVNKPTTGGNRISERKVSDIVYIG